MSQTAKKGMTREQATQLYDNLKKRMENKHGKEGLAKLIEEERKKAGKKDLNSNTKVAGVNLGHGMGTTDYRSSRSGSVHRLASGQKLAILMVILCAGIKLFLSIFEVTGVMQVTEANASLQNSNNNYLVSKPQFSKEEITILKSLDNRRIELENRRKQIEEKEIDVRNKEREYAARLTEIKTITQQLKDDRVKDERKKKNQFDQLANVYGSMNPKEAAQLIEQLDITIARQLIERMPEKRIAQILALMTPDRALTITRMLSGGTN
jgi:flagellar motility protein MotE (MotC chaperone)